MNGITRDGWPQSEDVRNPPMPALAMRRPARRTAAQDVIELLEAEGFIQPQRDGRLEYMLCELLVEHLDAAMRQAIIAYLDQQSA